MSWSTKMSAWELPFSGHLLQNLCQLYSFDKQAALQKMPVPVDGKIRATVMDHPAESIIFQATSRAVEDQVAKST